MGTEKMKQNNIPKEGMAIVGDGQETRDGIREKNLTLVQILGQSGG